MTHVIKFKDDHGDWWFAAAGRWSDSFRDALHFDTEQEARDAADAAERRLDRRDGVHRKARCKIVDLRLV